MSLECSFHKPLPRKRSGLKNRSEKHLPGCTCQILFQPPAPLQAGVQCTPSLLPHSLAPAGSEQWSCTDHGRPAGPARNLTGTPRIEFTGVTNGQVCWSHLLHSFRHIREMQNRVIPALDIFFHKFILCMDNV